jgi:hypothetical protein
MRVRVEQEVGGSQITLLTEATHAKPTYAKRSVSKEIYEESVLIAVHLCDGGWPGINKCAHSGNAGCDHWDDEKNRPRLGQRHAITQAFPRTPRQQP